MTAVTDTLPGRPLTKRVGPAEGLRQMLTLAWRSLVSIKHNPFELLDLSIQPVMFVLLFTYVFGGAIDKGGSVLGYLQFVLPGIIVQNAIFATLGTGVGLSTDLTKGVYDRLRSLPIARWSPLAGRILADTVKQAWALSLLLGVGMVIGYRVHGGLIGVLGTYVLLLIFTLAVSWLGVLVGVMVDNPEKVQIFGFVFAFPLTFTSNVFAPTDTMPGWLQVWVKVNPVTILVDAIRGLLDGTASTSAIGQSLLWAVIITVVFAPVAVARFRSRT
jgi:ABC-2 type transport system permease protein/oleandomycin transport system permease protein